MPRFSIFTPLGHLRFSRLAPIGKRLFDLGAASLGAGRAGTYKITRTDNGRTFAWLYAWAMTLGTVAIYHERASRQWDPSKVTDLLDFQERERGSIPKAGWTIGERRAQLARMRRLIQDVSANGVRTALADLLGASFLAYVPTAKGDAVNWPASLGDQPQLFAPSASTPRRVATLTSPIASVGSPVIVNYTERASGVEWQIQKGDRVVIEPEVPERAEVVTITSAGDSDGVAPYFLGFTPTKAHTAGVSILRAPWPFWGGSKRHSLAILTAEGALDAESRRLTQWLLERYSRATSTWDVAGASSGGLTAGPFTVGESLIGVTPIGLVTL